VIEHLQAVYAIEAEIRGCRASSGSQSVAPGPHR